MPGTRVGQLRFFILYVTFVGPLLHALYTETLQPPAIAAASKDTTTFQAVATWFIAFLAAFGLLRVLGALQYLKSTRQVNFVFLTLAPTVTLGSAVSGFPKQPRIYSEHSVNAIYPFLTRNSILARTQL